MKRSKKIVLSFIAAVGVSVLLACGGGGGSSTPATQTAYFIDSAVGGLQYTSGSLSGVTGADGSFQYQAGQPVTFKIGNLTLGSVTPGSKNIYPVDLVSGATDQIDANVTLISQVLQTLDDDGDPSNGITLSSSTQKTLASGSFSAIQLNSADPTAAKNQLTTAFQTSPITRSVGNANALISAAAAQTHLQSSLLKEFFNTTWKGTFSGTDSGSCQITFAPQTTGSTTAPLTGTCTSNTPGFTNATLNGYIPSSGTWTIGTASTGAVFVGTFLRNGTASGTWQNTINQKYSGTWTMTKQ